MEAAQGRYLNARAAQQKLTQLIESEELAVLMHMHRSREQQEKLVEVRAARTFLDAEAAWTGKLEAFDAHAARLMQQMQAKHQAELVQLWQELHAEPVHYSFSPELLDLRRREVKAARVCAFDRAHELQAQADRMEQFECEKLLAAREQSHMRRAANLVKQQEKKEAALRLRIESYRHKGAQRKAGDLRNMATRTAAMRWEHGVRAAAEKAKVEHYFHSLASIDRAHSLRPLAPPAAQRRSHAPGAARLAHT